MARKRLLVDMDGTLARFHDQDMYLERMFEKDFFRDLEPFENMVQAIGDIVRNHPEVEVFICSAKVIGEPPYCEMEKNAWLDRYLPEIDQQHRIFTDMGRSKAEYMPGGVTRDDYLLDDYNKGLNLFLGDGGSAIKVMNNINMRGLGAYGGDKGHMWTGPLVSTETKPSLIVGDILEGMGLSRDKNRELASMMLDVGVQRLAPEEWCQKEREGYFFTELPDGHVRIGFNQTSIPQYCASFGDAMKYFDACHHGNFKEKNAFAGVMLSHGENGTVVLPAWQLSAVCMNLGISEAQVFARRADDHALKSIFAEIERGIQPVYGRMDSLDLDGNIRGTQVFYDPMELLKEEQRVRNSCDSSLFSVEWYIKPKPEQIHELLGTEMEPWILTDDDCLQYRRTVDPYEADIPAYELCQIQKLPFGYGICHGVVDLKGMSEEKIEDYLHLYGYEDLDDFVFQTSDTNGFVCRPDGKFDREKSAGWIIDYGLISEMVFETNFMEYMDSTEPISWNEALDKIAVITKDESIRALKEQILDASSAKSLSDMLHDAENRQGSGKNTFPHKLIPGKD